jgi:hypothetical protein
MKKSTLARLVLFLLISAFMFSGCELLFPGWGGGGDDDEEDPADPKAVPVELGIEPGDAAATAAFTNTSNTVWIKAFDASGNQLAIGAGGSFKAALSYSNGEWICDLDLSNITGDVTFLAAVINSAGEHVFRAKATKTITTANQAESLEFTVSDAYAVGDIGEGGGKIFYVASNYNLGWRYLEAARVDSSSIKLWASSKTYVTNTDSQIVGAGKGNTDTIIAAGNSAKYPAAWYCADLDHNGTSDWFLPSYNELQEVYDTLGKDYFLHPNSYWSSSERRADSGGDDAAYYVNQVTGVGGPAFKTNNDLYVKAVRRF